MVVLLCSVSARPLAAEQPGVHYLHHGVMPPGAIGRAQLQRGGPLPGFFQPVEIKAPPGALISLAVDGQFDRSDPAPVRLGMLIGQVYRIRVMEIPLAPAVEVFPTIEIIDRLYTPQDQQRRFAIPIELTAEDLRLASEGKFVTRVIYLEDPKRALPVRGDAEGRSWFEVGPGRDPLAVADELGRPVAILRLGARLPDYPQGPDAQFLFGCPPLERYPPREEASTPQPQKAASRPAAAEEQG